MFNVGGAELLVIALVALIVLGPDRLPDAARQAGKMLGELRRISSGFQNELRSAIEVEESERPPTTQEVVEAAQESKARDAVAEIGPSSNGRSRSARPRRTRPLTVDDIPADER